MAQGQRPPATMRGLVREAIVMVAAVVAYFLVRGYTEASESLALDNAQKVIDFEKAVGLFWEEGLQSIVDDRQWLINFLNWVYIWGHWPVIATTAIWLYLRHQSTYFLVRNGFLISGAIGLVVFATFPVAPPRFTDMDVIDTVTEHSHAYRVLQPPAFVNQYAAMPSLHFGWNLLIGLAIYRESRVTAVRVFGLALPMAMLAAVILTANHFIIDAIAGAALALFGLYLARRLEYFLARTGPRWRLLKEVAEGDDGTVPPRDRAPVRK